MACGTIPWVTSRSAEAQRLKDLARLRRVRDRIDREYAQPLNVEALARDVNMSAGHLSRQFRLAYGESPYAYRIPFVDTPAFRPGRKRSSCGAGQGKANRRQGN